MYVNSVTGRTGSKMGISPLMLAAMNGHTAAVKLLLDMGSDINAQVLLCVYHLGFLSFFLSFTFTLFHLQCVITLFVASDILTCNMK